jgi:hypothetical protein
MIVRWLCRQAARATAYRSDVPRTADAIFSERRTRFFVAIPDQGACIMRYLVCVGAIACAAMFFSIGMIVADTMEFGYAVVASSGDAR